MGKEIKVNATYASGEGIFTAKGEFVPNEDDLVEVMCVVDKWAMVRRQIGAPFVVCTFTLTMLNKEI